VAAIWATVPRLFDPFDHARIVGRAGAGREFRKSGGVNFFGTYLGLCVPNPHARRRDTPDWNLLLKETLALTKMNWNGTQFDGALPITLKASYHKLG
jgi:hypothetical protein